MQHRDNSVLTRAAVLMGGVPRLAQWLGVSADDLWSWIGNTATAPNEVVANAAEIIKAHETDHTGTILIRLGALKAQKKNRSL